MSDRKTIAIALRERGTDFALLKEWSDLRLDTALKDFCAIDPNSHGGLACAQGQIREMMYQRNLELLVKQAAEIV